MNFYFLIVFLLLNIFPQKSLTAGPIRIVTTTPDLAWVTKQITKDKADVESLLTGFEDPHFSDALPSYTIKVANADIVCSIGLDLEIGWLPKVMKKSGNRKIQRGGSGYCETGSAITPMGAIKDGKVDRSMGDIHSSGNPHFYLSPPLMIEAGKYILRIVINNDMKNKLHYERNYEVLKKTLNSHFNSLKKKLKDVFKSQTLTLIQYHSTFDYFLKDYDFKNGGTIEQTPGVHPSSAHIAQVALQAKKDKINLAISSDHAPKQIMEQFSQISGIKYIQVPTMTRPNQQNLADYLKMQTFLIDRIIKEIGH